jgi:plastocyanin
VSMQGRLRFSGCALAALVLAAACGDGGSAPKQQAPPANAKRVDAATAGSVTGRVSYEGPAMQNTPVKLESDPACASQHPGGMTVDTFQVTNGGLDNVFVYVKTGLDGYYFETPTTPAVLDQKGCRYTPHVFGVRTGQPLEIVNSDQTMHNVHAMGSVNQEFNFGQSFQGIKNTKTFTAPEIMVPFKCNVHGWMAAYGGVVSHPYFAVTAGGGAFELKGLPPGTYTIEAWHEKLGTRTETVSVAEKDSKPVSFTFKATLP